MIATPQNLLKFTDLAEIHLGYRSNLVAVFSAGSMAADSSERVRARLCSNLTMGYVAGDATMVSAMPAQLASAIPGAVGYPLPGVMVEVVDDQDRALSREEDGKLRIRSEYGVSEYLDNADATRRAFRDGWFYPGHRGRLTNDNVLVLSSATANSLAIDVERVEEILSKHTNVVQCGVLALGDESGVQELCALVVARSYLDGEALRNYCQARLPAGLVPAHFVAVSELPRTADSRIDRGKLAQLVKSKIELDRGMGRP
jgi:acyl-coenzyme A synthetase/AMP-(fatty) acid ligase